MSTPEHNAAVRMLDAGHPPNLHAKRHLSGKVSHDARTVRIFWDDARESTFHGVWLRDNCACAVCRHPQTQERTYQLLDDAHSGLIGTAYILNDGILTVQFAAGNGDVHLSRFDLGWLRHHCESSSIARQEQVVRRLWSAAELSPIPRFHYDDIMVDDRLLDAWLGTLTLSGATLIEGIPTELGTVQRLAERVGPLRPTNFGTLFEVESKPNPNNAAYTAMGLEPHTDIPNVPSPPGIQLLHCIRNDARGGGSILVDGFRVAEELRSESAAHFRLLADCPIEFRFHDAEVDLIHHAPVLRVDAQDRVVEVRFSNWLRGTLDLPEDQVDAYYEALLHYWRILRQPRFQLRPRLQAGQAVVFDNQRVLHGREPFDPQTGSRLLQGCYIDHESVQSRRRVIARGIPAQRPS